MRWALFTYPAHVLWMIWHTESQADPETTEPLLDKAQDEQKIRVSHIHDSDDPLTKEMQHLATASAAYT